MLFETYRVPVDRIMGGALVALVAEAAVAGSLALLGAGGGAFFSTTRTSAPVILWANGVVGGLYLSLAITSFVLRCVLRTRTGRARPACNR